MVSTYHNRHWDGWVLRAVREIVEKQTIGEVYKVELHMGEYAMPGAWWRSSKSTSGGILYDWGVHLLEYALQVIPSRVTEVSGFAHEGYWPSRMKPSHPWKKDCIEDEATAIVRFKNGALINLSISQTRSEPDLCPVVFHGTKGCYEVRFYTYSDRDGWTVRKAGRGGKLVTTTGKHPRSRSDLYYKNIAQHLCGKEKLVITPQWARRPIHILDLAVRSAQQGRALKAKDG